MTDTVNGLSRAAYHGTPITPHAVRDALGRRDYCVSFFRPDQVEWVDENSRSYFIDNGIYSAWQRGTEFSDAYWDTYYNFCRRWCLEGRASWAVIPDPIGTGTQELDYFLREWPAELKDYGVPVYHLDEPIDRAVKLIDRYGRVAVGASGEYSSILSPPFRARMDQLFGLLFSVFGSVPPVHMFRGLQLLSPEHDWPITSADSTNIARNHNRLRKLSEHYLWAAKQSADRWDNYAAARQIGWPPPRLDKSELFDKKEAA